MTSKKGFRKILSSKIGIIIGVGIISYLLCISIVSGLESRGLSKLFIVNAKDLLKLISHFS